MLFFYSRWIFILGFFILFEDGNDLVDCKLWIEVQQNKELKKRQ